MIVLKSWRSISASLNQMVIDVALIVHQLWYDDHIGFKCGGCSLDPPILQGLLVRPRVVDMGKRRGRSWNVLKSVWSMAIADQMPDFGISVVCDLVISQQTMC